jgi:hypothetical protein
MVTQTLLSDDLQTEPQIDQTKNYLEELVGEGKKFKSPEDLAKGKFHSDQMIEIQNRRLDEMRADYLALKADYDARAKLEEIMDQYKNSSQKPSNEHPVKTEIQQPLYDPKQIEAQIAEQVRRLKSDEIQEQNFNTVRKTLTERFGNNYKNVLKQQAVELDLSDEAVEALARRSPKAFFKTFGLDTPVQTDTFQTPPQSSVRSDNFKPQNTKKRTWSYYQELKKSNPTAYRDPKTATQMIKDYEELGQAFEDGDFSRL